MSAVAVPPRPPAAAAGDVARLKAYRDARLRALLARRRRAEIANNPSPQWKETP